MTQDDQQPDNEPLVETDAPELDRLLSNPLVWGDVDPSIEDSVVTAIGAAAASAGSAPPPVPTHPDPTPIRTDAPHGATVSPIRRWGAPIAAGIAAALIVVVGFIAITADGDDADIDIAMAGTELAPDARADLAITTTPNGTRLVLDVSGLPPAPEGQVYEAWLRKDADVGVSAGTFHMRGGDGDLELWSGVTIDDYPLITVTLQDEADTESSGQVVLKALVEQ